MTLSRMEVRTTNGTKEWLLDGKRHREDGPAIEWSDGRKDWYHHGKYHRLDGPAIVFSDGSGWWLRHGQLHRVDGPAAETQKGLRWYFEGFELTEEQHARIRERIERVEKARAHRIKWFILDRLLPKLCSPNSAAFLSRFHADWDAALE